MNNVNVPSLITSYIKVHIIQPELNRSDKALLVATVIYSTRCGAKGTGSFKYMYCEEQTISYEERQHVVFIDNNLMSLTKTLF
jgi:hypothetical protein